MITAPTPSYRLRFRKSRKQLRTNICELLLAKSDLLQDDIAKKLGVDIATIRAELFVLRMAHVVRPVMFRRYVDARLHINPYYHDAWWELTKHGRGHDGGEAFHCAGCRMMRRSRNKNYR